MGQHVVPKWFVVCATLIFVLFGASARGFAASDPLVGTFSTASGDASPLTLTVKADPTPRSYTGTIEHNNKTFPFSAQQDSNNPSKFTGTFDNGSRHYPLSAVLANGQLTLNTGNSTYVLTPAGNPPDDNPLDKPEPPSGNAPAANRGAGVPAPSGTVIFRRHEVHDDVGNMDALSILVPDGWKIDAKIEWVPIGQGLTAAPITITDPKTNAAIRFYRQTTFADGEAEANARNYPFMRQFWLSKVPGTFDGLGREMEPLAASPKDYVERFAIPRFRPDLKGVDIKFISTTDMPADEAKKAAEAIKVTDPVVEESRIRVQYTAGNTLTDEEFDCKILHFTAAGGWTLWQADVSSVRAPAGQLDALLPTAHTVRYSISPEYPWWSRVQQVFTMWIKQSQAVNDRLIADNNARMQAAHDAFMQTQEDNSERAKQNFADQMDAKARVQEQEMNYIRGTQDYKDPGGGTVNLSNDYKFNYGDGNGGYIQSNDPTFQPPIGFKQMDTANPPAP
jgi:hypothetical protein